MSWDPLPSPNGHVGRMKVHLTNKLFGKWPLKLLDVDVVADQVRPHRSLMYDSKYPLVNVFVESFLVSYIIRLVLLLFI